MRPGGRGRAGLLAVVAFFSLFAAGLRCEGPAEATLGQEFKLRPGEKASISGEKVVVAFLSVSEDSRCPKGEQCIVAGKARVVLEVSIGASAAQSFELATAGGSEEMDLGGFQFKLIALEPYPVSGRQIRPEEYLASLSVQRL